MRGILPVALSILLVVAGCGESEDAFQEDYNRAVRPLSELRGELKNATPKEFERLARRTEATRQNLARLDPPADARQELRDLQVSLRRVTGALRGVAGAIRGGDPEEQRKASRELVESSDHVQAAERALQRAVGR